MITYVSLLAKEVVTFGIQTLDTQYVPKKYLAT